MRRAGLSALLIVCLSIFLCPEVAKPTVITVTETKTHDCCSKMSGCKMMPEQTSHHRPCGRESQPKSCCAVSCSTLILFCPISDRFPAPRFSGHTFANDDATASVRIEQPPTPPPRVLSLPERSARRKQVLAFMTASARTAGVPGIRNLPPVEAGKRHRDN